MQENLAAEIKSLTHYMLDHPESLLFARLAERYLRMHEVDKAIEICLRGLRNHPDYATGHLILAKCYLARKQYDEAEKRLKHVYTLENNYLNAYKLYGELMGLLGRTELQYASFKQIKKLDPLAPIELPSMVIAAEESVQFVQSMEPPINTPQLGEETAFEPAVGEQPQPPTSSSRIEGSTPSIESPVIEHPKPQMTPGSVRARVPHEEPSVSAQRPPQITPTRGGESVPHIGKPVAEQPPQRRSPSAGPSTVSYIEPTASKQPTPPITPREERVADSLVEPPVAEEPMPEGIHFPEEEDLIPDFSSPALFAERTESLFEPEPELEIPSAIEQIPPSSESAVAPKIDSMENVDNEEIDFEKEEERFSLILDDLFRPNLDEEEQREKDTWSRVEKAALSEPTTAVSPKQTETTIPKPKPPQPESRRTAPSMPTSTSEEKRPRAKMPQPQPPITEEGYDAVPPVSPISSTKKTIDQQQPDLEEQEPSALPTFGPDFSIYPHKEEDDEINEFIAHMERMGRDREDKPVQEEVSAPPSISPTPQPAAGDDHAESGGERTKEKFVTPTLGEIYAAQGQYAKAISVFEMLLKKNPDNEWYRQKLEYLRKKLQEEKNR